LYEKILVAIDESEVADRVLDAARELAVLAQSEIWVVHLREREPSKFGATVTETTSEAQTFVDTAVQMLTAAGVKASGTVRETIFCYAAKEIVNEADSRDAGIRPVMVVR
jgi:nucleotide-binding universal stress UspA family protein